VITFVLLFRFQTSFYLNNLIIFLSKSSDKKMIHRNIIGSYIKIGEMAILLQRNDAVSLTGSVPNQCRPDSALSRISLQAAAGAGRAAAADVAAAKCERAPASPIAIRVASKPSELDFLRRMRVIMRRATAPRGISMAGRLQESN
jgi:hypothetical protein